MEIKVLYVTNIQSPYRVEFLNQLSKRCNLTVLYERERSSNRDIKWSNGEASCYRKHFLNGINIGNEYSFSLKILNYILDDYDIVLFGCCNSIIEIISMLILKLFNKKFALSLDGELFISNTGIKNFIKKKVIRLPDLLFCAGEHSRNELLRYTRNRQRLVTYYFSSMTKSELDSNRNQYNKRQNYILVVGQYLDYKGMDIAAKAAKELPDKHFKFVGMGEKTPCFVKECGLKNCDNVEVIPFLDKEHLFEEYKKCKCLLLPSRQECWGLVVNEAASFGTPIISTFGSGAAVEFLMPEYDFLLAKPNDGRSLVRIISENSNMDITGLSEFLIEKSKKYMIENNVEIIYNNLSEYINAVTK